MAQIMTLLIRWAGQVGGKTVPLNNNNTTFFSIDFGIYKTKLMQKAGGNISSVLNYIVYILQSQWPVPRVHVFIQDIDPVWSFLVHIQFEITTTL